MIWLFCPHLCPYLRPEPCWGDREPEGSTRTPPTGISLKAGRGRLLHRRLNSDTNILARCLALSADSEGHVNKLRCWLQFEMAGLPRWLSGKEFTCQADVGSIAGSARSPGEGNGNPLQYSCLENFTDRGAWWARVHGVAKSQAWLSNYTATNSSHTGYVFCVFVCMCPLASDRGGGRERRRVREEHLKDNLLQNTSEIPFPWAFLKDFCCSPPRDTCPCHISPKCPCIMVCIFLSYTMSLGTYYVFQTKVLTNAPGSKWLFIPNKIMEFYYINYQARNYILRFQELVTKQA